MGIDPGALLGQVLGGSHNAIADTISQNTGMEMGALGKSSQEQGGLDANGIAQTLGSFGGGNDLMGMATRAIDAGGDTNIVEDLGNIIGKIF